jgi:hypothetical protein
MSALGTVKWYNSALVDHGVDKLHEILENNLVFGRYPVEFLNELAAKIPGDFFGSFSHYDETETRLAGDTLSHFPNEGTMMPFCRQAAWLIDVRKSADLSFHHTHDSFTLGRRKYQEPQESHRVNMVSSKTIAGDASRIGFILPGQIRGHERGASDTSRLPQYVNDLLGNPFSSNPPINAPVVNLHAWIAESPHDIFAVPRKYSWKPSDTRGGLNVFWGYGVGLDEVSGRLIKSTNFEIIDYELRHGLTKSETVNWIVS